MLIFTNVLIAYLIGSIPTAYWVGKYYHGIDIREQGSKNAGATNTFRVFGKKSGWLVLTVDVLKGVIAATLPYWFQSQFDGFKDELLILQLSTSFSAVVGHVFPIFAGFRGGKGVATSLGIVIGLNPFAAAICLGVFIFVFIFSKYVSLGAITASLVFPFVSFFILKNDNQIMIIFTIVLSFLVIIAHRKNISRLIKGEENKMNLLKKKA
jgi:glycerol-3-phosphate acyltransferase PlsY